MSRQQAVVEPAAPTETQERIWDAFRRWGYLQANLDPLGDLQPVDLPELAVSGRDAEAARKIYCGTIGVEFMHIPDPERRRWIEERMESEAAASAPTPPAEQKAILDRLVRAEIFEQVLQTRYLGTKRYSLEGESALVPLLDAILNAASEHNAQQAVLAMSHRGRLNVMVHIVGRPAAEVFAKFEDVDPRSVLGGGDVKYHIGATGEFRAANGRNVGIHLASNPSHLEAVDPVANGRARAKQTRIGEGGTQAIVPVIMHGDAAFAGQGIWAETLNMANVEGYSVGGSVHIIVNNLIGFTTVPRESHSSRFSSDLSKRLPIPIFHVNAEDPEAVARVGRLALDYRYAFGSPVVVDLIGYRKHGHSEVDDPTITQPLRYKKIQAHQPLWQIYAQKIGVDAEPIVEKVRQELDAAQKEAEELEKNPPMRKLPAYWNPFRGGRCNPSLEVDTGVLAAELTATGEALASYPDGFHIHPKVKKLFEQRLRNGARKTSARFRNGRGPGVRNIAETRHSSAPQRAGQQTRHFQPAPRGPDRHRKRKRIYSAPTCGAQSGVF